MEATIEKREAVGLAEKEKQATTEKLVETFNQLASETDKRIALAYLEGMAAATPQATA